MEQSTGSDVARAAGSDVARAADSDVARAADSDEEGGNEETKAGQVSFLEEGGNEETKADERTLNTTGPGCLSRASILVGKIGGCLLMALRLVPICGGWCDHSPCGHMLADRRQHRAAQRDVRRLSAAMRSDERDRRVRRDAQHAHGASL